MERPVFSKSNFIVMHREKNHSEEAAEEVTHEAETVTSTDGDTVSETDTAPEETAKTTELKKVINVKLAIGIAMLVIVLALLYSARGLFVAATVNGAPIGRMAVVAQLEQASGQKMLDALITKKLIAQAVAEEGKSVSPDAIAAEVKKLEEQIAAAGSGTLEELLAQQGMTMDDLRDQIVVQKQLEQLLGEKVAVTDAEVDAYIEKNKLSIPEEQLAAARVEISDQMKQQKMSTEGQQLVAELRAKASISYFVHY